MLKTNTVIAAQECHPPLIYVTLSKLTERENILLWAPPANPGYAPSRTTSTARLSELVFLNVYGAPESILRNEFRQPM